MFNRTSLPRLAFFGLLLSNVAVHVSGGSEPIRFLLPEQRSFVVRPLVHLPEVLTPASPPPPTVADPRFDAQPHHLSLDNAISIALKNTEVVRVLTGITANTSGRSIFDPAITGTLIDQERSAFDPQLRVNNLWDSRRPPVAVFDISNPGQSIIGGVETDSHRFDFGLSQKNLSGGTAEISVNNDRNRFRPELFPLNPQNRSSVDLSYTQPLLRGAGVNVNTAPIVLARIDAERSYFQYKDSVQRMVQGIIQSYWELVFAKTDLWAREQQVEQATFANERAQARLKVGDANAGEVAQTLVALENFRANLLASQANVLQRQAALLNILGLPPFEEGRTIPVTPMLDQRLNIDWQALNEFAQRHRPDIIELKLILEADQQRLLVSKNQALPQLDGVALYRWNGLEGEVPAGDFIRSGSGQFDDWALAVNFSVPVGLRGERAILRQQQLIIRRDQANLEQGLHQMQHLLALSVRNLEQYFAQYEKYQAVRRAAKTNLDQQLAQYNQGIVQFIVVLQAIVDWGNAVSNEAQALSLYNTEIATLAYHTGTILESHGICFFEERFRAIGPLGRLAVDKNYPAAVRPTESNSVYRPGDRPSEESFELENPVQNRVLDSTTSQEPRDLNERIEFESNGNNPSPPLSDEEIDKLLNGERNKSNEPQELPVPKSSWLTPKSLKRLFKR